MIERFLSHIGSLKNLSPATVKAYENDIRQYEEFISGEEIDLLHPDKNTGRVYAAFLRDSGLKPVSINRKLTSLRVFYDYAVRIKEAEINPFERVRSMKTEKRLPDYLQYEDIEKIREKRNIKSEPESFAVLRDRALVDFIYSTGCRVSEAARLETHMIDLHSGSARVTGKGNKERIVYLGGKAVSSLKMYFRSIGYFDDPAGKKLKKGLPVFINAKSSGITERGIFYIIAKMACAAGINKKVSPHVFRHSFATHMVTEGADIRYVQELLGHESLSTTQIYTHVGIGRLRNVYRSAHPHGKIADEKNRDTETI